MRLPVLHIIKSGITLLLICTGYQMLNAQVKQPQDSVFFLAHKKGLLGKIGKGLSVNVPEPVLPLRGAVKNETVFNKYRGKIIRQIVIEKIGFNKSVNDTTKVIRNVFNDIGNALNTFTAKKVIKNNLFFNPGDTLYPYLLADNETYLRTLTYLQDARITVKEVPGFTDSVDIVVLCKDVFPIGGSMDAGSPQTASFEVNDDNLAGTGNRIQVKNYYDANRHPDYGIGFEFLKRNIAGTFLNISAGYENEAPTFNTGWREERALYIRGDLPLVSPYHRWTGAFEIANHFNENGYLSDSLFNSDFKYSYHNLDGWIGYNIGAKQQLRDNFNTRRKRLISLRAVHKEFMDIPDIYKINYKIDYSNLATVLASYTIFEQDYYHTNFLYGFGRNEDVPEGFSVAFTGGWTRRNNISRPYIGFDYQRNYFSRRSNYLNYALRFGTYYNNGRLEDISGLTSIEYFTKLRKLGNSKWFLRHFMSGSITQLMHTYLNDPLRLSSDYGIPRLDNPTLRGGSTRVTFNGESVFYNTWKFVGFSFAPFSFANITYLRNPGINLKYGDIYTAIGGGVRTRNENLVFGTIEFKAFYYPRVPVNVNPWNITINSDIRFRYVTQLIKRPDFVVVN